MIVTVVLNPCYKLDYVSYSFEDLKIDSSIVPEMTNNMKTLLMCLYDEYKNENPKDTQISNESNLERGEGASGVETNPRLVKYMRSRKWKNVVHIRNEVDK